MVKISGSHSGDGHGDGHSEHKKQKKLPPSQIEHLYHEEYDGIHISEKSKQLHHLIHQELPVRLDEISHKYKNISYSTEQMKEYSKEGFKGVGKYLKDLAGKADHHYKGIDVESMDENTLAGFLRTIISRGYAASHDNKAPDEKTLEKLIRDFKTKQDIEIFNYVKVGLQQDEASHYQQGYLSEKLDHLSEEDKLNLAAAQASYMNIDSFGHHVPKSANIAIDLKANMVDTVSSMMQKYSVAKRADELYIHPDDKKDGEHEHGEHKTHTPEKHESHH